MVKEKEAITYWDEQLGSYLLKEPNKHQDLDRHAVNEIGVLEHSPNPPIRQYYVLGDVHGSAKRIRDFVKHKPILQYTDNVLILLGDVGANFFFNYRDEKFKKELGKYPFTYFCIRGNHEERPSNLFNVDTWHMENFEQGVVYVENEYPYIKYALDHPSIYALNDKWLTIVYPGAYSVDKYYRIQNGWTWFKDEMLTDNEMQIGRELAQEMMTHFNGVDLVLSHTCPIVYEPTDLFLSTIDQSTIDKTMERYLGEIEYNLKYKVFAWGHFHQTRIYPQHDNQQPIMLFDDYVLDLNAYMADLNNPFDHLLPTWKVDSPGIKIFH